MPKKSTENIDIEKLYDKSSYGKGKLPPPQVQVATATEFHDEIASYSLEEPTERPIDYVLVYKDCDDPSNPREVERAEQRQIFEERLQEDGLQVTYEKVLHLNFVKIYCPFKRMGKEAEKVNYEMDLAGIQLKKYDFCWLINSLPLQINEEPKGCIGRLFRTDEQVDYVSAPFVWNKRQAFEGVEKSRSFFRNSVRSLLVHNILINTDIRQGADTEDKINCRGLLYLIMQKAYSDAFVLHNPFVNGKKVASKIGNTEREELYRSWGSCFQFQPLWRIRNYFGEKIALYFAWLGLLISSLFIPMLFGAGCMIYGLYFSYIAQYKNGTNLDYTWLSKACDNEVTPYYGLVVCIWGTIFVEMWKRKCATLAYKWDVNNYELQEPNRPEFYGTKLAKDPVTGVETPIYPISKRIMKLLASGVCLLFMVFLVIASVTAVIAFRVILKINSQLNFQYSNWFFSITSSLLNTISIMILGRIYSKIAKWLNDWENYRTQTEYDDSLILKTFAFQFVNSYTSLFYIAFFRKDIQRAGLFNLGTQYRDSCGTDDDCMSLLTIQVAVLLIVKPMPKFFRDIILPWLKQIFINKCTKKGSDIHPEVEENALAKEYYLYKTEDFTMSEYTEKILMYGYLMLFATAFPLAPLLAILIMSVDMRIDCRRLLHYDRRLLANRAQHIGMWMPILNFLNIAGVVSNAFLIAFTSSFATYINIQTASDRALWIVVAFEERYQVERIMASTSAINDDEIPVPNVMPQGNNNDVV
ncbi:uncharacterized protein TRIADDRAFT_60984 [Trichoplax adhaerens]|uniref:Anoctamin n=1 Tax=Trichoplax adhaerens TaxID=10228 RepID=B3S9P9_TRIAD|nr:hypothetical protein TRIADDRAFT_60984 [Trichoplax adhaerens]EDV20574.1 hypothetical protein TRIADDRAFT_60984 [Trichoplax adhaerens]|eukprot:XP_002117000.1 hypothetical protein TRIADDRAFT_60984 [Trichoplax adhaerens]